MSKPQVWALILALACSTGCAAGGRTRGTWPRRKTVIVTGFVVVGSIALLVWAMTRPGCTDPFGRCDAPTTSETRN